ncbi:MAG: zinc-ribbon domain-containing protein [Actinomycetota bacterium]|nr:zinc-ribbon domain-containing protein [Actinomycetota bacterium]
MYCPKCGKQIEAGSRFCPNCGNALQEEHAHIPEVSTGNQKKGNGLKIAVIVLAAIIVLGGIAAGITISSISKNEKEPKEEPKKVEETLLEAKERARKKLLEADALVQELSSQGVDVSAYTEEVADAEFELEGATSIEEANEVYEICENIIENCNELKSEEGKPNNEDVCRQNQKILYDALKAYYEKNGNYPDQFEYLVQEGFLDSIPKCPDGGTYDYFVNYDVTPEQLSVSCSVHGQLYP